MRLGGADPIWGVSRPQGDTDGTCSGQMHPPVLPAMTLPIMLVEVVERVRFTTCLITPAHRYLV